MNKLKISIFVIITFSLIMLSVVTFSYADNDTTTTASEIIQNIDYPANADNSTSTTIVQCYDLTYNSISFFPTNIGQDNNLQPCELLTQPCIIITHDTIVFNCELNDGKPIDPIPPVTNSESSAIQEYNLPSTGLNEIVIVIALVAMALGLMLMLVAIRKSNIK